MITTLRIPVLVLILLVSGPLQQWYAQERMRLNIEGMVASLGPWLLLVGLALVFLLVAGAQRDARHPGWVLSVEIVLAVLITIVPPLLWSQVFGVGLISRAMGANSGVAFAQLLAVAWLLIAVRTIRAQRRARIHS